MEYNVEMTIRLPKELEADFRLFIVLHCGQIVKTVNLKETKENEE